MKTECQKYMVGEFFTAVPVSYWDAFEASSFS